jgi:hypothetical protein
VLTIAGNEVSEFLAGVINEFSEEIMRLNSMPKKWFWLRVGLALLFAIIGIIIGIYIENTGLLILLLAVLFISGMYFPYYYSMKRAAGTFSGQLAKWIRDHRGPLYAKGIRPRPGHGGVFILFEMNMVS